MLSMTAINPTQPDAWRVSSGQDSAGTRTVDLTVPLLCWAVQAAQHKAETELMRVSGVKRTVRLPLDLTLQNGMCLHIHPITGSAYTLLIQHIEHLISPPVAETRCEGVCVG